MQDFRTNKLYMFLQGLILVQLVVYAANEKNRVEQINTVLLSVLIVIFLYLFFSSISRRITFTDNNLTVKGIFKTTELDYNAINYGYLISALGRYVLIVSDGTKTATISSAIDNFYDIVQKVYIKLNDEDKESFDRINLNALKLKSNMFIIFMLIVNIAFLYINVKSYLL